MVHREQEQFVGSFVGRDELFGGAERNDVVIGAAGDEKWAFVGGDLFQWLGGGDLIEIRDPQSGDTFLYPFTKAVVPEIRIADGYVVIEAPLDAPEGEEEPD